MIKDKINLHLDELMTNSFLKASYIFYSYYLKNLNKIMY